MTVVLTAPLALDTPSLFLSYSLLPPLRRTFSLDDCGDKSYKELLQQYPRVARVFNSLEPSCQAPIRDICKRMGDGMAEFIEKEVVTVEDFDLYCHYVAGVRAHALSRRTHFF